MSKKFWGELPLPIWIFSVFYMLVPALCIYLGLEYIKEPWIMMLVVHWVIMIAIPWFIIEVLECYGWANIGYGFRVSCGRDDFFSVTMALTFALLTVGLYWLFCVPFKLDPKGVLKDAPLPEDTLVKILAIGYFIFVKPYIEEWFWRRYNYDVFTYYEFDFWFVSFFWALTYTAIAINIGANVTAALIVCLVFTGLGRFLIWMRFRYEPFANYITHMGVCIGVTVCYFLADAGKF